MENTSVLEKHDFSTSDEALSGSIEQVQEILFETPIIHGSGAETIDEDILLQKMAPYGELDDKGYGRQIFRFGEATVCFRSREELPLYQTALKSSSEVLGDPPRKLMHDVKLLSEKGIPHDDQKDALEKYEQTKKTLEQNESGDLPEHYNVSRSIRGVVELLTKLDPENQTHTKMLQEINEGVYSERSLLLIDAISAVELVDTENQTFRDRLDGNSEAIVTLAMLGDAEAQNLVTHSIDTLRILDAKNAMDESTRRQEHNDKYLSDIEAIKPESVICVHATSYEPEVDENGDFLVPTTFDAAEGYYPRASIHVSLNHKVVSHAFGQWESSNIVLLSPLSSMIEENGLPSALESVDTWWNRNPGEKLKWADGVMVKSDEAQDELMSLKGNVVSVKAQNFTEDDVTKLVETAISSGGDSLEVIDYELALGFRKNPDEFRKKLISKLQSENPEQLKSLALQIIVNSLVHEMGGDVTTGGMWSAGNSDGVLALARDLGVERGGHHMDGYDAQAADFTSKEVGDSESSIERSQHIMEAVENMDPKTRRVLYASGMRTMRFETDQSYNSPEFRSSQPIGSFALEEGAKKDVGIF